METTTTSTTTTTASSSSSTSTSSHTLTTLSVPYPLPLSIRPTVTVPPMPAQFKLEELPADTNAEDVARLTESHSLERVPPTEKKKYPSKRCKVCLRRSGYTPGPARKHPKESVYHCPQCPSKPGLCCYPCYYVYHSKLNYWEPDGSEDKEEEGSGSGGGGEEGKGEGGEPTSRIFGAGLSAAYWEYGGGGGGFQGETGGAGADGDQREQKFCPVPVYGESVYGPGGQ